MFYNMIDKYVLIYLYGILVYSESSTYPKEHLRSVLQKFREEILYIKVKIC